MDLKIAVAAFDCLGRDLLVGGGLLQMVLEDLRRVIALDVLAEELLTREGHRIGGTWGSWASVLLKEQALCYLSPIKCAFTVQFSIPFLSSTFTEIQEACVKRLFYI